MKFFQARRNAYHTEPKLIDDVIYTPYMYDPPPNAHDTRQSQASSHAPVGDLLGIPELREDAESEADVPPKKQKSSKFDTTAAEAEIFLFDYGTVVIWGMTEAQERRFLSSMYVCRACSECDVLIYPRWVENGLRLKNWVSTKVCSTSQFPHELPQRPTMWKWRI